VQICSGLVLDLKCKDKGGDYNYAQSSFLNVVKNFDFYVALM
jgi:hypothetical protein